MNPFENPNKQRGYVSPFQKTNRAFEGTTLPVDSQYDILLPGVDVDSNRAARQTFLPTLGNAAGRTIANIIPGVIENAGYIGDLSWLWDSKNDHDNWLSSSMRELKEKSNESMPIYRYNPDRVFDLSDSAWWLENGSALAESVGQFAITGFGVGAGLSKLASGIGAAARVGQAGATALKVGTHGLTATALTHAEGTMTAVQVYDQVKQDQINKGIPIEEAERIASEAASTTWKTNFANVALNLTSTAPMVRGFKNATKLTAKGLYKEAGESLPDYASRLSTLAPSLTSFKRTAVRGAGESVQESLEEVINAYAQNLGMAYPEGKSAQEVLAETLTSEETGLAAILGAVGGLGNTAVVQGLANLRLKGRPNANDKLNETYLKQKDYLIEKTKRTITLQNQIKSAIETGDKVAYNKAIADLQAFTALDFFGEKQQTGIEAAASVSNGSADVLKQLYQEIAQLKPDEALAKGFDIDPDSDEHYAKIANESIANLNVMKDKYAFYESNYSFPFNKEMEGYNDQAFYLDAGIHYELHQKNKLSNEYNKLYSELLKRKQDVGFKNIAYIDQIINLKSLEEIIKSTEETIKSISTRELTQQEFEKYGDKKDYLKSIIDKQKINKEKYNEVVQQLNTIAELTNQETGKPIKAIKKEMIDSVGDAIPMLKLKKQLLESEIGIAARQEHLDFILSKEGQDWWAEGRKKLDEAQAKQEQDFEANQQQENQNQNLRNKVIEELSKPSENESLFINKLEKLKKERKEANFLKQQKSTRAEGKKRLKKVNSEIKKINNLLFTEKASRESRLNNYKESISTVEEVRNSFTDDLTSNKNEFTKDLQILTDVDLNNKYNQAVENLKLSRQALSQAKLDNLKLGINYLDEQSLNEINSIIINNEEILIRIEDEILKRSLDNVEEVSTISEIEYQSKYKLRKSQIEEAFKNSFVTIEQQYSGSYQGNVFTIRGEEFFNLYSEPLNAINRNENGDIVSVSLSDKNKKTKTFTDENLVDQIAFAILSQEVLRQSSSNQIDLNKVEKYEDESNFTEQELNEGILEGTEIVKQLTSEIKKEIKEYKLSGFSDIEIENYVKETEKYNQLQSIKETLTELKNQLKELKKPIKINKDETKRTTRQTASKSTKKITESISKGKKQSVDSIPKPSKGESNLTSTPVFTEGKLASEKIIESIEFTPQEESEYHGENDELFDELDTNKALLKDGLTIALPATAPYVETSVGAQTISNDLSEGELLEERYSKNFIKEGDQLTFERLTASEIAELKLRDPRYQEDENLTSDTMMPVKILRNGEFKGYLHTDDYIREDRVTDIIGYQNDVPIYGNHEIQKNRLKAIRQALIKGEQLIAQVNRVSDGWISFNKVKGKIQNTLTANAITNPDISFAVMQEENIKQGDKQLNLDNIVSGDLVPGVTVALLPLPTTGKIFAHKLSTNNISDEDSNTITKVIEHYLSKYNEGFKANPELVNDIQTNFGLDINNPKDLQSFLSKLIYIADHSKKVKSGKGIASFTKAGNTKHWVTMSEGKLYAVSANSTAKQIVTPKDLQFFKQFLTDNIYYSHQSNLMTSKEWFYPKVDETGRLVAKSTSYNDYIKQTSNSAINERQLPNGQFIYTDNPQFSFDVIKQEVNTVIETVDLTDDQPTELNSSEVLSANIIPDNEVQFSLKSIQILQTPKADEIFRKGDKNNWSLDKILNELQVPKEQQELVKSFNTRNREEILTSLLANYSYTIEINTATESKGNLNTGLWRNGKSFEYKGSKYEVKEINYTPRYYKDGQEITFDEIVDVEEEWLKEKQGITNTQYYSNLTVPGGTNYTENEIATPAITPSIKGHAQFATDKGIGWFRSDEQVVGSKLVDRSKELTSEEIELMMVRGATETTIFNKQVGGSPTKTRRILEVQSDLFQKGRDREDLINKTDKNKLIEFLKNEEKYLQQLKNELEEIKKLKEDDLIESKLADIKQQENIVRINKQNIDNFERFKKLPDNQFLQLLNKDNNWVTFFIKSIMQSTAKQTVTEVQQEDIEAKVRELEKSGLLKIKC